MCGIAGIFKYKYVSHQTNDVTALRTMLNSIQHRGPDGEGMWHENGVSLGHRRLATIDLSPTGHQPMISANGRYVITYNGEVYNHAELRQDIPIPLKGTSDTEVILEYIAAYGLESTLSKLNGMFAFALWDRQQKKLILVRDTVGIKPLYYGMIKGGFVFSSELKAIATHPDFNKERDPEAVSAYFNLLHIPHPLTIYRHAKKLPQGYYLEIDEHGRTNIKSFAFHTQNTMDVARLSDAERVDCFEQLMGDAVARHAKADVPVAGFLSGGNDSALIAAIMAKSGGYKTYSIGYEDKKFDESDRAQKIAEYLSLPHEKIILMPEDAHGVLDKLAGMYDEPYADSSAIPTFLISQTVQKYTKVALSGDGADELFAGYPRYTQAVNEWKRFGFMPAALRRMMACIIPHRPNYLWRKGASCFLKNPELSLPYLKKTLQEKAIASYFHHHHYNGLESKCLKNQNIFELFDKNFNGNKFVSSDLLRDLLNYNQSYRLPDDMLTKVDRASMAASLEVRVPFLDQEIVHFSKNLPSSALLSASGQNKKIIKDVLRRYVPSDIVDAPKTGFHIPMKIWLREHFSNWAKTYLQGDDEFLDMDQVKILWNRYEQGGSDQLFYPIWGILMYRQWQKGI